jgi:nucleoside-diphosphate-sugar epimerase
MRVLLTGHKGYIGSILAPMLRAAGHEPVGLDTDLYRNSGYGQPPAAIPEMLKDIRDVERADLVDIGAIIHLAGLSNDTLGDLDPELTYEINHAASVRLAELAKAMGISRYVFASSCSNYGAAGDGLQNEDAALHPVTAYAISKVRVERDVAALADSKFTPVFMRNATAYGVSPKMRFDLVVNNLTAWAYTTGDILLKSDGTPWRPLVHIEDISRAAIAAMLAPRELVHNRAFNVGQNSENYQIRDLAEFVKATVPGSSAKFVPGAEPDKRNYRVDFSRFAATFPGCKLQWTVKQGVQQCYESYKSMGLERGTYESPKYLRIGQIKQLMREGQLDDRLRWRTSVSVGGFVSRVAV